MELANTAGMNIKTYISATLFVLFALQSCTFWSLTNKNEVEELQLFPAPPAEPRVQFLTSFSTSSDIKEFNTLDQFLFGSNLLALETAIEKPFGATIHHGKIYICDSMLPGLIIIDLQAGTFEPFHPTGRGLLRKPINVVVDTDGMIYVSDTERSQIVVFTPDLHFSHTLSNGSQKPLDMAIMGDSLFVVDYEDRNLEIWSIKRRKFLSDFPPQNNSRPDSIRLFVPYAVDISETGHIYVTDYGQFRIQEYDTDGTYIKTYGGIGRSLGKFARPKGLAVDHEGNVFVVDTAFENVQIFNSESQLLMFFGGPYKQPGDLYLPAQVTINYDHNSYFEDIVIPGFDLDYIILVTSQYGPDKLNIYGLLKPEVTSP